MDLISLVKSWIKFSTFPDFASDYVALGAVPLAFAVV
ncbi:hypothetical protein COLO4_08745 [Corchorus olitorius]|uniref:Uncharacterized protein n=1 Tax=Corchorus olitorius TaxID=93759 RepID=A0A1R3KES2_9ROSI|nr:hypothetical protein COLO4_08745 [Corchorus olitorius]